MTSTYKKRAIPNAVRREVCSAAGARLGATTEVQCAYCPTVGTVRWVACDYWPVLSGLELDHVMPERHGGQSVAANLVLACRPCNRRKKDRIV